MAKSIWGALGGALATVAGAAAKNAANKVNQTNKGTGTTAPSSSVGGGGSTPSAGNGYSPYAGGNVEMDKKIKGYSDAYATARASGDIQGMRNANDAANQIRNQYGYAAQHANTDIDYMKGQTGYNANQGAYGQLGNNQNDVFEQWKREQDSLYEQQQRQLEEANRAAVEQAVGSLNAQKQGVDQSYSDLFKELYVQRRMSEKNLPQQMAAMGYSGGLSESTALNLQNTYADALRQGEQERLGTMGEIDRAATDARLQGDANLANQAAQLAQNKLSSYSDLVQAQLAQQNLDKQFGYQQNQDALSQENWNKSFAYQQAQDEWNKTETTDSRKLQLAQIMAQYGDFSGFAALGIDPSTMKSTYAASLAKGSGSGSGGGRPAITYSQMLESINSGVVTPGVLNAYEYYMGEPYESRIKSADGLGEYANGILNQFGFSYMSENNKVSTIQNAAKNGRITKAETQYLLDYIGY